IPSAAAAAGTRSARRTYASGAEARGHGKRNIGVLPRGRGKKSSLGRYTLDPQWPFVGCRSIARILPNLVAQGRFLLPAGNAGSKPLASSRDGRDPPDRQAGRSAPFHKNGPQPEVHT